MGIICSGLDPENYRSDKSLKLFQRMHRQLQPVVIEPKNQEKIRGQSLDLSPVQKNLMKRYWQEAIMLSNNDIFHKTMLASITSSPKMNEIIACGSYCYRDLRKWPKLNKICQAQFEWFQNIIISNLNENEVREKAVDLGRHHAKFAQYGLKPHFLDIYQLHLIKFLGKLKIENEEEKDEFLSCWITLMDFIVECMNFGYAQALTEAKQQRMQTIELR
uniref:Globin family profile domain-containing protein n=1 Tax=Acrobeloides nanus TaxID=290746 RepID=A0A914E0P6_9BILA